MYVGLEKRLMSSWERIFCIGNLTLEKGRKGAEIWRNDHFAEKLESLELDFFLGQR